MADHALMQGSTRADLVRQQPWIAGCVLRGGF
jgi:hypothetical protein